MKPARIAEWATVELPIKATVGKTISLLKEAK
jgi:hypothetical protein